MKTSLNLYVKSHLAFSLLFFIMFISLQGTVLNVSQIYQEQTEWCWAATSQTVLLYYGFNLTQQQIAQYGTDGVNTWNWIWGSSTNPTRNGIDLILEHFGSIQTTRYESALSLTTSTTNINSNKPFFIRWGWDSGGGHFVVCHGTNSSSLYLMDPWYGPTINSYSWVVDGSTHTWTHSLTMDDPPTPILNASPTSLSFGNVQVDTYSDPQTYSLTGDNLTANITVSAPSHYEVSLSQSSGYGGSVSITPNGFSVNSFIYVRFNPITGGPVSDNITNTSIGTSTVNVDVTGIGIGPPVAPIVHIEQISDIQLRLYWEAVTEDIYGNPIAVSSYNIEASDNPYSGFTGIGTTSTTTFIDTANLPYRFYLVIAVIGSRDSEVEALKHNPATANKE